MQQRRKMFTNLLYGLPVMALCLLLQTSLLIFVLRYYARRMLGEGSTSFMSNFIALNTIMLVLITGNLGQIAIWASLFFALQEFSVFSDAFYHSSVNFSALGYGDVVMSEKHRLLGALEAINGILMIGVTTTALMIPFKNVVRKTLDVDKI